ncbi:hypothetical protein A5825_003191 [Enterococcus gallinarum]|nr:hypothetical protein A5825_003191 [Enterococcus gallinarum]
MSESILSIKLKEYRIAGSVAKFSKKSILV